MSNQSKSRKASPTAEAARSRRARAAAPAAFAASDRAHGGAAAVDAQALGAAFARTLQSFASLTLPGDKLGRLQGEYLENARALWNQMLGPEPARAAVGDRRFAAADWAANASAAYTAQMYLLNARTLLQMAEALEGDEKTRQRVRFAVQQWIDAASPSNFLALNPEAQRKAIETGGASIAQGMRMLLEDLQHGHVSQTDKSVFEVGRNVATTEGAVVFENPLFQLIEYRPLTQQVHERPLLMVPPCINKYYILDLQPENSFIRYAVEQGHRVFVLSWRNPDESMSLLTWDDYIQDGAIRAIGVVREITGQQQIDTLGFCIGGTILTTALAVLTARGEWPASSVTLLTTLLDFANTGVLDLFIDEAGVRLREMTIGAASPNGGGLLRGVELAQTFSFLRPNDLVWNYVVGNYLKGETPPPFDLLYWNGDSTNLPGPMACWYLRNTYLENRLKVPGALKVCGQEVDLGAVDAPVYIYASREDHIVPWDGAYRSTQVLKGPRRFVMGASGHIAGVINPPAKGKRSHWIGQGDAPPADHRQWFASAVEHPGSWWPDWARWLGRHAGSMVAAPKRYGRGPHKALEPAPGRYVKQKA